MRLYPRDESIFSSADTGVPVADICRANLKLPSIKCRVDTNLTRQIISRAKKQQVSACKYRRQQSLYFADARPSFDTRSCSITGR